MWSGESRRGRADLVDTRASSGEVPSIKVGIGESNGQFITMRGYLEYTYLPSHSEFYV